MAKLPSFQFYPGDWRKDPGVQSLSYHDRGVWFEMLCLMFESDDRGALVLNGRPMRDEALARLLGLDKQNLTTTLTSLLESGVASRRDEDGAIICRRMVRDEHIRKVRSEAGKRGGNPNLLKQNLNQSPTTGVKQNPTPSSSSSSSSSSSEKKKKKGGKPPLPPLPVSLSELDDHWAKWVKHRTEIRKPLTPTSCEQQFVRLEGMGIERAKAAIDHTIANGWQGMREPDVQDRKGGSREDRDWTPEERAALLEASREDLE